MLPLARAAGLPLATLTEYIERFDPADPGLAVVAGELRSHARGNILPGVISIRVGLKQAMAHAERTVLEAEALATPVPGSSYQRYFHLAWHRIVASTAHDSVTGCGVDETAEQVEGRLPEAAPVGRAVRDRLLDALSATVPGDAYLVVNPLPVARTVLAEVEAPGLDGAQPPVAAVLPDGTALPAQELPAAAPMPVAETLDAAELGRLLRRIHGRELFGPDASAPVAAPVSVSDRLLDNGEVWVEVAGDGTLTVSGPDGVRLTGVGRLADGGDRGDSYNYGPPAQDVLVDQPAAVSVTVTAAGPLRGTLRVVREFDWPLGLAEGDVDHRSDQTVRVPVTTLVSLCAGEPYLRLAVWFVNLAADHRLRLHIPLSAPVTSSEAEGQFGVTRRGLTSEGGWGEYPLPTFPAYGFVAAGAATVLLEHATEYELVADGSELALTLLRAVGWMSVNVHPLRDEPAGSQLAVPGAQYLGREVRTRLALLPGRGGWATVDASGRGAEFRHGGYVRRGAAPADRPLPDPVSGVEVTGDGVAVSSLRPVEEGVEVRLVAMTDHPSTAMVGAASFGAARRTDLLGRPGVDLTVRDGMVTIPLNPWEIATLRLS